MRHPEHIPWPGPQGSWPVQTRGGPREQHLGGVPNPQLCFQSLLTLVCHQNRYQKPRKMAATFANWNHKQSARVEFAEAAARIRRCSRRRTARPSPYYYSLAGTDEICNSRRQSINAGESPASSLSQASPVVRFSYETANRLGDTPSISKSIPCVCHSARTLPRRVGTRLWRPRVARMDSRSRHAVVRGDA